MTGIHEDQAFNTGHWNDFMGRYSDAAYEAKKGTDMTLASFFMCLPPKAYLLSDIIGNVSSGDLE
jgi:hypothetical protein